MPDTSPKYDANTGDGYFDPERISKVLSESSAAGPDLTDAVIAQFQQDLSQPLPCQYDYEFLSTYFDRELGCDIDDGLLLTHRIDAFEQHLPHCLPCNEQLGLLMDTTETYRQYLYRLEGRLDGLELTHLVMNALENGFADILDETEEMPTVGCGRYTAETMSAHVDAELPAAERDELENHLLECLPCAEAYDVMAQCSGAFNLEEAVAQNIPDCWPAIAAQLQQEPVAAQNVVKLKPRRRWTFWAGTAVAASLLFLVFTGRLMPGSSPLEGKVNAVALQDALMQDEREAAALRPRPVNYAAPNTIYHSPEAYLFSSDPNVYNGEEPVVEKDVSAMALYSNVQ